MNAMPCLSFALFLTCQPLPPAPQTFLGVTKGGFLVYDQGEGFLPRLLPKALVTVDQPVITLPADALNAMMKAPAKPGHILHRPAQRAEF